MIEKNKMFEKLKITKLFWKKEYELSLFYSKVKSFLISKNEEKLFNWIKWIKITQNWFVIETNKPIINSELRNYLQEFIELAKETKKSFWINNEQEIKITFK